MNVQFETKHGNKSGKDEWLTPPELVKSLGKFDLDPCQPIKPPFLHAKKGYNENDLGLFCDWSGRVWCNPPYGEQTKFWLEKCASHNNAIALIFARTETSYFFEYVWQRAAALFFIKGRIKFYNVDGTQAEGSAGAPSVLIAYGKENIESLKNCSYKGKLVIL